MTKKYFCRDTNEMIYVTDNKLKDNHAYRLKESQWRKAGIGLNDLDDSISSMSLVYRQSIPIERLNYSWLMQNLGVLSLAYDLKGIEWAVRDYLDKHLKPNMQPRVVYFRSGFEDYDRTGRSLRQILTEGYRGNRIDVMVGEYWIYLFTDQFGHHAQTPIGMRVNGQINVASLDNFYTFDSVLNLFTDAEEIREVAMRYDKVHTGM